MSPSAKSKRYLEKLGYLVETVERWISFGDKGGIRRDAFGFGDLLAIRGNDCVLVQVTSADNLSARRKKIKASPCLELWKSEHRRVELHGWAPRERKPRVEEL